MQFGQEICVKVTFKKDLRVKSKNITLDINMEIKDLEHNKTNEYLVIKEADSIKHSINKEKNEKRIL